MSLFEHGTDLWPPTFHDLNLQAQIQIATQLSRQSSFLRSRPFIHSAANLDNIVTRLNKDKKDEFGWSLSFDPLFISQLCLNGFLPMAGQCFSDLICLLPKLHQKRCLLTNQNDLKISKGTKKRSRHFEVTMDQAFNEVIKEIQVQHGDTCWFYAPLTDAYREIHKHNNDITFYGVRIHSIEVWRPQTLAEDGSITSPRQLVAGEIGYTVGGSYTSLSGFRHKDADGAGTVQCCALAKMLDHCGFKMWDLGMGMQYKYDLGAKDVPRNEFLSLLASMKDMTCVLSLEGAVPASNLLRVSSSTATEDEGSYEWERREKKLSEHVVNKRKIKKNRDAAAHDEANPPPDQKA